MDTSEWPSFAGTYTATATFGNVEVENRNGAMSANFEKWNLDVSLRSVGARSFVFQMSRPMALALAGSEGATGMMQSYRAGMKKREMAQKAGAVAHLVADQIDAEAKAAKAAQEVAAANAANAGGAWRIARSPWTPRSSPAISASSSMRTTRRRTCFYARD